MATLTLNTAAGSAPPRILPAFDDAVAGSQRTFRAALNALAHPGRTQQAHLPAGHPAALMPATTALLLTLADVDTPVWLPAGVSQETLSYLRFHCGCPLARTPREARFIVVPAGFERPALADCHPGDPSYPDQSGTLLLEVDSLDAGAPITLTGPGIATQNTIAVSNVDSDFWLQWHANHRRFPLGVDVFFIHQDRFCGLPRTTHAKEQKCTLP